MKQHKDLKAFSLDLLNWLDHNYCGETNKERVNGYFQATALKNVTLPQNQGDKNCGHVYEAIMPTVAKLHCKKCGHVREF